MGIRESLLNTITSVSNGDFIRVVTAAGASSKATLVNVIKSFETGLGSKSSLTTSDYIRVVGSDNVSYKQLVSAVMTAMGLDAIKNPATNVANVDTATSTGLYSYAGTATGTKPTSSGGDLIVIAHSATYSVQVAITYSQTGTNYIYTRVIVSGTPTEWKMLPTRTEVDTLNNKRAFQGWGTSLTFTLTNGRQALVFVNNNEIYLVWNPTSSALNVAQVFSRSGQATATIARGDSNTEIVVTTTTSSSITALVVS